MSGGRPSLRSGLVFVLLALAPQTARATLVLEFGGTVTQGIRTGDRFDGFPQTDLAGRTFAVRLTTEPDRPPATQATRLEVFGPEQAGGSFGPPFDAFHAAATDLGGGLASYRLQVSTDILASLEGIAPWSSPARTSLDFTGFQWTRFRYDEFNFPDASIWFVAVNPAAAVPEPPALTLAATGLLMLAGASRLHRLALGPRRPAGRPARGAAGGRGGGQLLEGPPDQSKRSLSN